MEWLNRVSIILEFVAFWFGAPAIIGVKRLRYIEGKFELGLNWSTRWVPCTLGAVLVIALLLPYLAPGSQVISGQHYDIEDYIDKWSKDWSKASSFAWAVFGGWLGFFLGVFVRVAGDEVLAAKVPKWARIGKWDVILGIFLFSLLPSTLMIWFAQSLTQVMLGWLACALGVLEMVIGLKWLSRGLWRGVGAAMLIGWVIAFNWQVVVSTEFTSLIGWAYVMAIGAAALLPSFSVIDQTMLKPLLAILENDEDRAIEYRSLLVGAALFVIAKALQLLATF